jgi:hypothetical protein
MDTKSEKGAVSLFVKLAAVASGLLLLGMQMRPATAEPITGFPSAYAVGGTTSDGVTSFGPVAQYAQGNSTYVINDNGANRWGDYSETVLDPINTNRFWTIQEVAQAPTVWQTQIAEFSIGPGNTLNPISSFAGSTLTDTTTLSGGTRTFRPPDSTMAAGPSNVVEMTNGVFAVYNKSGVLQQRTSLDAFWTSAGVTPTNFSFDPRLVFDAPTSRWIAVAADNANQSNNLLVAVSKTSDPAAGWKAFAIPANPTTHNFGDFPTLGVNNNGVFITTNNFVPNNGPFQGNTVVTINKAMLEAGTLSFSRTENQSSSVSGVAPQPVVDLSNSGLPAAILGEFNTPAGVIRRSDVTGTIASPTVTSGPLINVNSFNQPTPAVQPSGAQAVGTPDTRFASSVVRTASNDLWGVQTVFDPVVNHDAIRWLDINGATNTVRQQGVIRDANFAFYYPSIAVNSSGGVVIGFSGSAPVTPETLNSFQPAPGSPATSFSMVLPGDQRTNVSLLATGNDPLVNAYAYVNQKILGSGTSNVAVSLDAQGNTVLTYTGSNPILPSYRFDYGAGPGSPHFGFDGAQGSTVISQFWQEQAGQTSFQHFLPLLSVIGPEVAPTTGPLLTSGEDTGDVITTPIGPQVTLPISYATFYANVTCKGETQGQWNEVSFMTGTLPTLMLNNPTDCTEILSDVGFILSETHIPLDDLNLGGEPPPGFPGSRFTDLPGLDGTAICPGCTIDVGLVSEPAAWLLLAVAWAGGVISYRRRMGTVLRRPGSSAAVRDRGQS